MTIDKALDDLYVLYERMDTKDEFIEVSDISIESVDIAIEALKAINEFNDWKKEVHGDGD
jgi:hypothetical protein